mmetsp:Transcript_17304/g.38281  ORF Transcript_17304/g.38281 Transcript_17304/m.38281 type:complete len:346 (-) Transcript_17304:11-1048(-)
MSRSAPSSKSKSSTASSSSSSPPSSFSPSPPPAPPEDGWGTEPPKLNHRACISPGLIRTYSSLMASILPRLLYMPTHCCSGPSLVSILLSAWSSWGLRRTSSCALSLARASSRPARPSGMPRSALAPLSRRARADTAPGRSGGLDARRDGTESIVSSHPDAALSMPRAVVRWVRRFRSRWRTESASLEESGPDGPAAASAGSAPPLLLPTPPLPPPDMPPSRPLTSVSIPSSPALSLDTSAAHLGTTADSSAPTLPISSWHDCVLIWSCRASDAMRRSRARPSSPPSPSSPPGGGARAALRYEAAVKEGEDRRDARVSSRRASWAADDDGPTMVVIFQSLSKSSS